MKAIVKATGAAVEVRSRVITSFSGEHRKKYIDQDTGVSYFEEDLFFPKGLVDDPDYWEKLLHQYAGMAMQGLLSNPCIADEIDKEGIVTKPLFIAEMAKAYARALVKKMKEERK